MESVPSQLPRQAIRGFTLVEVMVAAALSAVVFAMAFAAMIRFSKVHLGLATQANLDREFRYAVNYLMDDFRGLNQFELIEPEEDDEDGFISVVLTLPSIENEDGVLPDRTEVTYSVNEESDLLRHYAEYSSFNEVIDEKTFRLISGVNEFDVVDIEDEFGYDITLTSKLTSGGQPYDKTLSTRVTSRN